MRKDGCYRHSEIGQQNKRKVMRVYKQSNAYKKRVEEREKQKREALEAEAEKRVEEKKKQIIEEYRQSLRGTSIEDKKLFDSGSLDTSGEGGNVSGEPESDNESHPYSCSTCMSDSELTNTDQKVDEIYKKADKLQECDEIDIPTEIFEDLDKENSPEESEKDGKD